MASGVPSRPPRPHSRSRTSRNSRRFGQAGELVGGSELGELVLRPAQRVLQALLLRQGHGDGDGGEQGDGEKDLGEDDAAFSGQRRGEQARRGRPADGEGGTEERHDGNADRTARQAEAECREQQRRRDEEEKGVVRLPEDERRHQRDERADRECLDEPATFQERPDLRAAEDENERRDDGNAQGVGGEPAPEGFGEAGGRIVMEVGGGESRSDERRGQDAQGHEGELELDLAHRIGGAHAGLQGERGEQHLQGVAAAQEDGGRGIVTEVAGEKEVDAEADRQEAMPMDLADGQKEAEEDAVGGPHGSDASFGAGEGEADPDRYAENDRGLGDIAKLSSYPCAHTHRFRRRRGRRVAPAPK